MYMVRKQVNTILIRNPEIIPIAAGNITALELYVDKIERTINTRKGIGAVLITPYEIPNISTTDMPLWKEKT